MSDIPSRRKDALALGELRFFTGKPCRRGHVDVRVAVNGCCIKCKNINNGAYKRRNPEKTAASKRRWVNEKKREQAIRRQERRKKGAAALRALRELGIQI